MNNYLNKIKAKIKNQPLESQKEINGSRNLLIFLAGSLGIALVLVIASLILYTSDGTIQLDLSRPVLQEAREAQKKPKRKMKNRRKMKKMKIFRRKVGSHLRICRISKDFIQTPIEKSIQMSLVKMF